jgi:hypothetical protein
MNNFETWQQILFEWSQVNRDNKLNQRLYDQLGGSIIYILNYAQKNNIILPNRDNLYRLIKKADEIMNEINCVRTSDFQQFNKITGNST